MGTIAKNDATASFTETLRSAIVSGEWAPGEQLPRWYDLEKRFGVSRATITRAIGILKQEGFAVSFGRRGVFVAENPPHLWRYGLVFQRTREWHAQVEGDEGAPTIGDRLIMQEAARITDEGRRRVVCYRLPDDGHDQDTFEMLDRDVRARRLAGVIMVGRVVTRRDYWQRLPIPVVTFIGGDTYENHPEDHFDGLGYCLRDRRRIFARFLDHLKKRGCLRVAAISLVFADVEMIEDSLAKRDLETGPGWVTSVGKMNLEATERIAHLILGQHPEALIVSDDNLAEGVARALASRRLRVPEDIGICLFTNWSDPVPFPFPAYRAGMWARQELEFAIDQIDRRRRKGDPPQRIFMPVLDEAEFAVESRTLARSLKTEEPCEFLVSSKVDDQQNMAI